MANWTHKLDIKDLHSKYQNNEITPVNLGQEVAARIREMVELNTPPIPVTLKEEALDIAERFDSEIEDIDDYDSCLESLYDWGDTTLLPRPYNNFSTNNKLCWINTF